MTQEDQRISNGLQALRYEVGELRKETKDISDRVIRLEVGVGVMRWLFAALLAILGVSITVASVIIGYIQGG